MENKERDKSSKHIPYAYKRICSAKREMSKNIKPQHSCSSHAQTAKQKWKIPKKLFNAMPCKPHFINLLQGKLKEHLPGNKKCTLYSRGHNQFKHAHIFRYLKIKTPSNFSLSYLAH